ncbi:MAG: peptide-methionine (S)-S-oxide reductase MsrA [Dehalococcoidia bacterium]|nr:peptide-methionine (S)-S-oxide reductase MsrA [Dehalococcoidia bacterium]
MNQHNGSRSSDGNRLATLAGGCFWCLEAVYNELRGVEAVVSGYAGGHDLSPTYEAVCSGTTGHAEVVQIAYDPDMVSFRELLEVFFTIHDPTTLNRQGNDVGTQYRSAVYFHDEEQRLIAEEVIEEMTVAEVWDDPIVTEITALDMFFEAEEYHQRYFEKNPFQPYCFVVVRPKVSKFRKKFVSKLKKQAV